MNVNESGQDGQTNTDKRTHASTHGRDERERGRGRKERVEERLREREERAGREKSGG